MNHPQRIAIFVSFSGEGGVERMVTNLARGFIDAGFAVDMVLAKARGKHLHLIPAGARVVRLKSRHASTALPGLIGYLRRERPAALLVAKDRPIKTAVLARLLSGVDVRLVGRLGTTVSAALKGRGAIRRWVWYQSMRGFYRGVDRIVAVSQGVADDVLAITGLPAERVCVIRNPVIGQSLSTLAAEPVDHPWFQESAVPVIVGAGRLTRQKDFPTLLKAFARLRAERPARLVILGEGRDRSKLETLARDLGVDADVALPGFVANPYPYLARASLFVLSSLWEGSPNVLTEALALGVPVVATDCPSGPREILQDGRYGPLVPMGDVEPLATAMEETLDRPLAADVLQEAVRSYTIEASSHSYLDALGLSKAE